MNTLKSINFLLTTLIILIFSNSLFSQNLGIEKKTTELAEHIIASKIMGNEYKLRISFPQSYSTKDTISYPALYVLDGSSFYAFKNAQERLIFEGQIEDVIIVGIGFDNDTSFDSYAKRHYQFTPSVDTISDRETENGLSFPEGTVKSGGATKFLKCMKTEIIPFVDKHYKTNTDRGISGSKLGGLFTAYCFINSNSYFTRFGINGTSLAWNKNEVLNQATLQFTKNKTWDIQPTKVFISGYEPFIHTIGQKTVSMVPAILKFSSSLERSNYENINLTQQILVKEPNMSISLASSGQTLSALYGKDSVKATKHNTKNYYKYSNFYNLYAPDYNIDKDSLAVEGYDLTEYFINNRASKGSSKYSVKYKGIKYFFLNEKNKSIFIENPEKYLPQFGGYCADKMGAIFIGNATPPGKHPINPEYFMIIDNKLYLYGYGNSLYLKRWKQNKKENIEASNKVWESISKQN